MAYNKETAEAIRCAGRFLGLCVSDPDPKAKEKYQEEFNCLNCEYHPTCVKVLEAVR